ncbi:MAG: mannose-6-phosphate isomerase, class I [Acidimicrobiales bacterium]
MRRLETKLQYYDWGDKNFIASLQQRSPSGRPEAELWAGAHENCPSDLEGGAPLDEAIAADPVGMLGAEVAAEFGTLPFLAKFLAAAQPLSLQAHPSPQQAAAGFERERASGVPLGSPQSVYRDRSHKPELICALTVFEAKCGFKPVDESRELFDALGGGALDELQATLVSGGSDDDVLRAALTLALDSDKAASLVPAVVEAAAQVPSGSAWDRELRWISEMHRLHAGDPAAVASLLLNHVVMQPGQALYLGSGTLHSYLSGAGVEVMASSDNVVRAGLSQKPVHVGELLAIVRTSPEPAPVQTPSGPVYEFEVPAPEFSVTRVQAPADLDFSLRGPEILMVAEGSVAFFGPSASELSATAGTAVWVPASDEGYRAEGSGTYFRVGVGSPPGRT